MIQAVLEWMRMDGYGAYVWSVLILLIVVFSYEVGRLKIAQQRNLRRHESLNEEVEL